jgi:ribose/xylose/arabinose/galactoside ABC-type transport system permease subunit
MTVEARPVARAQSWLANSALFMLGVNVIALAAFAISLPDARSAANLQSIAVAALPLLLLAAGQTFVLVAGGIDLSAPALVGLSSVAGALIMSGDAGILGGQACVVAAPAAVIVMLATGSLAGAFNGLCVARLGMPAFMVTLTMAMGAAGLSVWMTQTLVHTDTLYNLPESFLAIGRVGGLDLAIALGATAAAHVLLGRTLPGRWMHAVGHNARASHVAGVPTARVIVLAYALSGLFAALAALLITARLETASPAHGRQFLLDVIGAAVIGGTSLAGGIGTVAGTAAGVLFLSVLANGLTLLNLSDFVITIVKGLVILAAALLDHWRRRWTTGQLRDGRGVRA